MAKQQNTIQKSNNWWRNLPHKWFLAFQIIIPFLIFILLIMAQSGISLFLWLILIIFVIQFYLIKHYYGGRCLIHCLMLYYLFLTAPLAFVLLLKYILELPISNDIAMKIISLFSVCAPFISIIPQYWRYITHGRK